jgi:hypothetical protein
MKTSLVLILLLSGCANMNPAQLAVAQNTAAQSGAAIADEIRSTAEWTLCNAITVGAWRRAYAGDQEKSMGWAALCAQAKGIPDTTKP